MLQNFQETNFDKKKYLAKIGSVQPAMAKFEPLSDILDLANMDQNYINNFQNAGSAKGKDFIA